MASGGEEEGGEEEGRGEETFHILDLTGVELICIILEPSIPMYSSNCNFQHILNTSISAEVTQLPCKYGLFVVI